MTKIKKKGYWEKSRYISQSNTGYWSKWGGARFAGDYAKYDEWSCQACSKTQYNILPSYSVSIGENEFVRVCALCRFVFIRNALDSFEELIDIVRKPDVLTLIANLITVPRQF